MCTLCEGLALAGILFYNEGFFDKEVSEPINADFLVEQRKVGKTRYVLVKFYKPGDKNELLGEVCFLLLSRSLGIR